MSMDHNLSLSHIDTELEALLQHAPPIPPLEGEIPELRRRLADVKRNLNNTIPLAENLTVEDIQIPTRDNSNIAARVYSPKRGAKGGSPLFVMLHGGGWCLGGLENEEMNCRNFCAEHDMVVLNVDYRLAPEYPFPTPVNDAYDAVKWAAANASGLKANLKQGFIVGGSSAGGNLAAVVANLARDDENLPPLTGIYLCVPIVVHKNAVPEKYKAEYLSYEQNKNAPILSQKTMDIFYGMPLSRLHSVMPRHSLQADLISPTPTENYKPTPSSPLTSPLLHPTSQTVHPPTYFQICGMDPLRDEAFIYERLLREDFGVKTKVDVYPGLPHAFWNNWPQLSATRKWAKDGNKGVGWLLGHASEGNRE
ncbi:MAG: hypothetical protein M1827_006242 [Pycnora praestabilis]|nr:MAG: hypothetical protein M1827_006242 [Pycnora praestabilis]